MFFVETGWWTSPSPAIKTGACLSLSDATAIETALARNANKIIFIQKPPEKVPPSRTLFLLFVELGFDGSLDLFVKRGIVFQRIFSSIPPLRELSALIAEPGAALLDDLLLEREIEQRAGGRNAFVIHDVELGFGERRRDFVLHDFHARSIARHDAVGLLDRADAPDVHANARVEFQRLAARSRLRIAKHHPDFFSDLVRENATRARFRDE